MIGQSIFFDTCCCPTLFGPFLGPLPQELQEELLSWEVGLFHMSPSSASHWPVDMPISSPPFPQLSCIGLGPRKGIRWGHKQRDNLVFSKIIKSNKLLIAFHNYLLICNIPTRKQCKRAERM